MNFTDFYDRLLLLFPNHKHIWSDDKIDAKYAELKNGTVRSHAFVTINWKPGTTPRDTVRILDNVFQKNWINKYLISYEQRGETVEDCGNGYHNHVILYNVDDKAKSQIQREIFNTCKSMVGSKLHIHVDKIPTSWLKDKEDYINGIKWDSAKDAKIAIDKIFRKNYNL